MEFGARLKHVMRRLGVSNTLLARKLPVDPALVAHWRGGRRLPDRGTCHRIAQLLIDNAALEADRQWLESLPGGAELPPAERLVLWLWDDAPLDTPQSPGQDQAGVCFLGAEGFVRAVELLAAQCPGERQQVRVYLSSERTRLAASPVMDRVWKRLHGLGGKPVPVYLEQSQDAAGAAALVAALLPQLQAGRLELRYIPSNRRFFCYHITVLARGAGLVMATEPASALEQSVSMVVGASPFVDEMARVLSALHDGARPLFQLLRGPAEEEEMLLRCYDPGGEYSARFGYLNPLYADPEDYRALLKANGADYDTRRYRLDKFRAGKKAFEAYLRTGRYREVVPLGVLDRLARGAVPTPPDLDFLGRDALAVPEGFVAGLLRGMSEYLERYAGLELLLLPAGEEASVNLRMKEDRFLLWQMVLEGGAWTTKTENWPLVLAYARHFDGLWQGSGGISGRDNVRYVLGRKRKGLEAAGHGSN